MKFKRKLANKLQGKISQQLKNKHKAEAGFETVITMPVVFILLMLCLFFFFTMMSYVSYNNLANTLAQKLDMRATGYKSTQGTTLSANVLSGKQYMVDGGNTVNNADIKTYAKTGGENDPIMIGGLNAAVNSIAKNGKNNQLNIPFTAIKSITAINDKKIDLNSSRKNAGNTIKVVVEYYPVSLFGSESKDGKTGLGAVTMQAVGYATIS